MKVQNPARSISLSPKRISFARSNSSAGMSTSASRSKSFTSGFSDFSRNSGCSPHFSSTSTTISDFTAWPLNSTGMSGLQIDEQLQQPAEHVDAEDRQTLRGFHIEVRRLHVGVGDVENLAEDQPRFVQGAHPRVQMLGDKG